MITRWDDARGFGFITPSAGGQPVFVHVSEFPRAARPVAGTVVTFRVTRDDRNRLRASDVGYAASSARRVPMTSGLTAAGAVAVAFLGLLALLAVFDVLPVVVVALSVLMSGVAFALYRADKSAAIRGAWRVSESTLQTVSLLGGWPGALLAQRVYRHKTRKQPFQTVFWITVVTNCAVLGWVAIGGPIPL